MLLQGHEIDVVTLQRHQFQSKGRGPRSALRDDGAFGRGRQGGNSIHSILHFLQYFVNGIFARGFDENRAGIFHGSGVDFLDTNESPDSLLDACGDALFHFHRRGSRVEYGNRNIAAFSFREKGLFQVGEAHHPCHHNDGNDHIGVDRILNKAFNYFSHERRLDFFSGALPFLGDPCFSFPV